MNGGYIWASKHKERTTGHLTEVGGEKQNHKSGLGEKEKLILRLSLKTENCHKGKGLKKHRSRKMLKHKVGKDYV